MFDALSKEPQEINDVVRNIQKNFSDVSFEELKKDCVDFFAGFVDYGFLSIGETYEKCEANDWKTNEKKSSNDSVFFADESDSQNGFNSLNPILKSLHVEATKECNERCLHCYIPHKCKSRSMDSDLFYRLIDECRKMKVLNITLSGGEPLMHSDIVGFLKRCREYDFSVNLLSNLTLMNDMVFEELTKNPLMSVQTSLYSIKPEIHDSITQVRGSCEKTKEQIERIIDAGIPVQIVCPVMKQNKEDFSKVVEWGGGHDLPVLVDYMIFGEFDHSRNNLVNRLELNDVSEILDYQLQNENYLKFLQEEAKDKSLLTGDSPICSVCRYYSCVSANGSVFPCAGWQENSLGDIHNSSLEEIWNHSSRVEMLRGIKRKDFGKCLSCRDKDYCTVCMMKNCNEDGDNDMFKVNAFNCNLASLIHSKVEERMSNRTNGKNHN